MIAGHPANQRARWFGRPLVDRQDGDDYFERDHGYWALALDFADAPLPQDADEAEDFSVTAAMGWLPDTSIER